MERNDDWVETHFEVVARIAQELEYELYDTPVYRRYSEGGRGGLYELAEELTNEFQELHKDRVWDGEFFDVLEEFLNEKLNDEPDL